MKSEFKKSTVYRFAGISHYETGVSEVQNILQKPTGELNAMMMDAQQFMNIRRMPFDIYIHVIEGKLETRINEIPYFVGAGEFIIIPAHALHTSQALEATKLLQLTIKSGYEEAL